MILRHTVTVAYDKGLTYARANVWTEKGHSSKTFLSPQEAASWEPKTEKEG